MKEQENTSHPKKGFSVRWIFNSLMVTGVILGWLISASVENIGEARRHQGSGTVTYGEPEKDEIVSEAEYKRHEYAMNGGMLILGLVLWISVAYGTKKEKAKKTAKEEHLDATIRANAAYQFAFAKVMGAAAYGAIHTEAMKDPAYQEAKYLETVKSVAEWKASKACEG